MRQPAGNGAAAPEDGHGRGNVQEAAQGAGPPAGQPGDLPLEGHFIDWTEDGEPILSDGRFAWEPDRGALLARRTGGAGEGGMMSFGIEAGSDPCVSDLDASVPLPRPGGARGCDPFTVAGWAELRREAVSGGDGAENAALWCRHLNMMHGEIMRRLEEAGGSPEAAGLDAGLVTVALTRRISESVGEAELPDGVDYDDLCRYALFRRLEGQRRQLIGRGPEENRLPAVIGRAPELAQALDGGTLRPGSDFREAALLAAAVPAGEAGISGDAGRMARNNDALVRRVFAPLTRTPPEDLLIGRVPAEGEAGFRKALAGLETDAGGGADDAAENGGGRVAAHRLDPLFCPWIENVRGEIADVLRGAMGGAYSPEIDIWEIAGYDMLLARDHAGTAVYAWPRETRQVLLETGAERPIPMIDRSRIPGEADIVRLTEEVSELRAALLEDARPAEAPEAALPRRLEADGSGPQPG